MYLYFLSLIISKVLKNEHLLEIFLSVVCNHTTVDVIYYYIFRRINITWLVKEKINKYKSRFAHLAFIRAIVSFLHVFYLQCPIVRPFSVKHGKPFVVRVREHARGQYVPIPAANPRYLRNKYSKT